MNPKFILVFLASIFLLTAVSGLEITAVTPVAGNPTATVAGNFSVKDSVNMSDLKVETADTSFSISFAPSTFNLVANEPKVMAFSIAIPANTAPQLYKAPFSVKNASGAVLASSEIAITVNPVKSLSLTSIELSKSSKNGTITLTNTGNVNLNNIKLSFNKDTLKDDDKRQITLTLNPEEILLIEPGKSQNISVLISVPTNLNLGEYSTTLNASTTDVSTTSQIKVVNSYCKFGKIGEDIDITDLEDTTSDNDWEWHPLDEVKIKVKVRNDGDNDEDVEIKWDLYDTENNEFIDLDDNEMTVSIDEGDSETATFTVKVPSDVEEDIQYRLYVKASVEGDEDEQCTDEPEGRTFQEIDVEQEKHDVIITSINAPELATCGAVFDVSAKLTNIGKSDEEKVRFNVANRELNINTDVFASDLDEKDSKIITARVQVPQNATAKKYALNIQSYFDYDDDSNTYDEVSEAHSTEITVENCQPAETKKSVSISAELLSEVMAGKQISIRAGLKNTGDAQTTYTISVSGIDEWATIEKIDPQSITLEKGESKDVLIYLNAKPEASGEKEFIIRATYAGKLTEQKAALEIQPSSFDTSKIKQALSENWFIWLIVLVNIVLIILIIIAARRLAK